MYRERESLYQKGSFESTMLNEPDRGLSDCLKGAALGEIKRWKGKIEAKETPSETTATDSTSSTFAQLKQPIVRLSSDHTNSTSREKV